jgi:hypothetical protein
MRRARRCSGVATPRDAGLLLLLCAACSSPAPTPPATPTATPAQAAPPAKKTDVRSRLQGTWELTAFESLAPIPDEAAPILSRLHGTVRLRFEGDQVKTFISGTADEETCSFEIADENGDSFTLITGLGMFRRARARFVSDDTWEATENGPTWPGTTRFARVKP